MHNNPKMSVQIVNEIVGQYHISKGVTKIDLENLANNPKTQSIQFVSPLSDEEIEQLELVVFSKRPDISLRVYGHYGETCDLSFIQRIPSLRRISADCLMDVKGIDVLTQLENLEHLGVGVFNLDNFDFLDEINPNLTELYLHQTRSKKPKINSLQKFENLEYLYLEGQQKGIETISNLKNLKKIVLRSISTNNIDYLKNLEHLWSVDIKLGGIKDLSGLESLKSIKYLELWQVRDLGDLSFISKLETLQNLFIQSLKQLTRLPDFSNNKKLRRIYLENLKGLNDLSSLKNAPSLKEFIYVLAENQEPEKLIPALENTSIESVFCKFGSDKKNNRFDALAQQYNKTEYKHKPFVYK
ncbi:leucine-rich repeat domain-containing protein [Sphingobacterium litopenaei]|uniref:Leucine-rich repeat domain-containing protein n=1 Tax=Sphingobacterium litopenaei TaxID=2763500 RepID=A0ABR7YCC4_9SPHI|nr:hypothetical protein [Sphingobacterium litopenaei]MBD1428954.1 hypothetical protein [Sphingobacterium litopenaei]